MSLIRVSDKKPDYLKEGMIVPAKEFDTFSSFARFMMDAFGYTEDEYRTMEKLYRRGDVAGAQRIMLEAMTRVQQERCRHKVRYVDYKDDVICNDCEKVMA